MMQFMILLKVKRAYDTRRAVFQFRSARVFDEVPSFITDNVVHNIFQTIQKRHRYSVSLLHLLCSAFVCLCICLSTRLPSYYCCCFCWTFQSGYQRFVLKRDTFEK